MELFMIKTGFYNMCELPLVGFGSTPVLMRALHTAA
jgi:hypothetical protein